MKNESIGNVVLLEEPKLQFGHSQLSIYPKDGLTLYGPPTDFYQPTSIRYGVIGTPEGIQLFRQWVDRISQYIPSLKSEKAHFYFWPGFSAAFNAEWSASPIAEIPLDRSTLKRAIRLENRYEAIFEAASLIEKPISKYCREEDRQPDLWFVVIPDEIYSYGRPASSVPKAIREKGSVLMDNKLAKDVLAQGSFFAEDEEAAQLYLFDLNFRAQLKARLLNKAVLQIVRESTLSGGEYIEDGKIHIRRMQDPATTAWNLCTTAFFKTQGSPWKLASVREGVCYIGLVFKRDETVASTENV